MPPTPQKPPNPPNPPDDDHLTMLARREAYQVIGEHLALCPFAVLRIEERLRVVEMNYAKLIGFMTGSGILGGAAGGVLVNFLQ